MADSRVMTQRNAPVGTLALLGHPANRNLVYKRATGWIVVANGREVDDEEFRAGWFVADVHAQDWPDA